MCVREQRKEDNKEADDENDLEFWLVTEGWKNNFNPSPADCVAGVEVVGSLLPLHHQHQLLLGKLPGLVGSRVEDCGVLLPCDEDEEKGVEATKSGHPNQQQHPVVRSRGVQTEREGTSVLGVVRRKAGPDTHSPHLSLRPLGWGTRDGKVGSTRIDSKVGEETVSKDEVVEDWFDCSLFC